MILDSFFGGGPAKGKSPEASPSPTKSNLLIVDPDGDLEAQKPIMKEVAKLLGKSGGRPKKKASEPITEPAVKIETP